jgi:hypothetical protein
MNKFLTPERRGPLLIVALAIIIMVPAAIFGVPRGNDLPHHYRMATSLHQSLSDGALYPGWNNLASYGYGDVSFRFYPPLLYYLLSLGRALAGGWYYGSILIFTLLTAAGGLGVYYWAKAMLPRKQAVWAGIFYLIAPFHVNEFYQACLLTQYAAGAVLPFAFAFAERVCRRGAARECIGLAVSYALLVLTHLPLAVIGSVALAIYSIARLNRARAASTLARLAVSVAAALAASAFFWFTMVSELSWMRGGSSQAGLWFDYRYNFLFGKVFDGSNTWWANILGSMTVLMLLPALALLGKRQRGAAHPALKAVGLVAVLSLLMTLPVSEPVWQVLAPLQRVEFPWRWLTILSMSGPVALAATIDYWKAKASSPRRSWALLAFAPVVITTAFTAFQIIRPASFVEQGYFEPFAEKIASSKSLPIWLPAWADDAPRRATDNLEIAGREFIVESWERERRVFRVGEGAATDARVRTFYYPHWVASSDAGALQTRAGDDGALIVSLPERPATVTIQFQEPPRRLWSIIVSIASWIIMLGALPALRNKRRVSGASYDNPLQQQLSATRIAAVPPDTTRHV